MGHAPLAKTQIPLINFGNGNYTANVMAGGRALDTGWIYHVYGMQTQRSLKDMMNKLPALGLTRSDLHITGKVECENSEFASASFNRIIAASSVTQMALQALEWTGVQYYDVLLLHYPCQDLEATIASYRAMEELQRRGLARQLGVSNFNASFLNALLPRIDARPVVNQCGYSIAGHNSGRWGSDEVTARRSEELGMTYLAYSPLGTWTGVEMPTDVLEHVAAAHGVSPTQVALRWVVQQGRGVVTATGSLTHTKSDLQVLDFELTSDEMRKLSSIPESCDVRNLFNSCPRQ